MNKGNKKINVYIKDFFMQSYKIIIKLLLFILIAFIFYFVYQQYQIIKFQNMYNNAFPGTVVKTGTMKKPRSEHANILLQDGNVLVVGGNRGAEIFNPKTGQYKLINSNLEKISFNVHNYFVLDNGNILIANKYLFDVSKYKFINLSQDNNLYNNLSLSGETSSMSNVFELSKEKLIFSILNQNNEININCYNKLSNNVEKCKSELYKYLFPLNKVFNLKNDNYLFIVSFEPSKYKADFDNTKNVQNQTFANFILFNKKNNHIRSNSFKDILSFNVQTIFLDEKNIWMIDNNSNLLTISLDDFSLSAKTQILGNFYFSRFFKIDANTLVIVTPVYRKPSELSFVYFDTNRSEIVKTINIKNNNLQSQDFRIRKSYDVLKLQNNDFLINGGQLGTYSGSTKTNESYILKQ